MLLDEDVIIIPQPPISKKIVDQINKKYLPYVSKEKWNEEIQYLMTRKNTPPDLPSDYNVKSDMDLVKINDCNVYMFSKSDDYETIVLYIHGGSYVYGIRERQVWFCDDIVKHTGYKVCIPCYPLAPKHSFEEAYALLDKTYNLLLKEKKRIIIIGDSAGAGLALGFAQCLKMNNLALPDKMVLISPFVDATLSNPEVDEYDKKDVMLNKYQILDCGKYWAMNSPLSDYRISPINGNMNGLPSTMIFASDSELMCPDCVRLYKKLKKEGVDSKLILGSEQIHVFVLVEEMPDAEQCREMIYDFISIE